MAASHQLHLYLLTTMDTEIGAALAPVGVLGFDAATGRVCVGWVNEDPVWQRRCASLLERSAWQPAAMTEMDIAEWADRANGISWDIREIAVPPGSQDLDDLVEAATRQLA